MLLAFCCWLMGTFDYSSWVAWAIFGMDGIVEGFVYVLPWFRCDTEAMVLDYCIGLGWCLNVFGV